MNTKIKQFIEKINQQKSIAKLKLDENDNRHLKFTVIFNISENDIFVNKRIYKLGYAPLHLNVFFYEFVRKTAKEIFNTDDVVWNFVRTNGWIFF